MVSIKTLIQAMESCWLYKHCENDSLWSNIVLEKEEISHLNNKRLQLKPFIIGICWKHTKLCNKGVFFFFDQIFTGLLLNLCTCWDHQVRILVFDNYQTSNAFKIWKNIMARLCNTTKYIWLKDVKTLPLLQPTQSQKPHPRSLLTCHWWYLMRHSPDWLDQRSPLRNNAV